MQFLDKDGKKLSDSLNKDILNRKTEKPKKNMGGLTMVEISSFLSFNSMTDNFQCLLICL